MRPTALAALASLFACGGPEARVEVHLVASHARPAEIREVWSTRFRDARDRELLAIMRAEARLEPPGLVLDATVRVPTCDASVAEATRAALVDLATGHHAFALHRPLPDVAEAFAERVRKTLGADVSTPSERPGQVVTQAPFASLARLFPEGALVVEDTPDEGRTALWVLERTPALDGSAIATAGADIGSDRAAIDVTFTPEGARTMQSVSEAARGHYLVLLVDGRFALAPRVLLRVSRTLRLELPPARAAEALALARAIAASNLTDPPTLVSAEARCATPD